MGEEVRYAPVPPPVRGGPRKTSGLAVASLVLAFLPFAALIAIVLGIVALVNISSSRGTLGGKGLAIAGIVVGGFFKMLSCVMVLAAVLFPALARAREEARAVACRANLKQIGLSIGMYQADYDEQMPPDFKTLCVNGYINMGITELDTLRSEMVDGGPLVCPGVNALLDTADIDGTSSFYYARVARPDRMQTPGRLPIVWDKLLNHGYMVNVLFADFHVEAVDPRVLESYVESSADKYAGEPPPVPGVARVKPASGP